MFAKKKFMGPKMKISFSYGPPQYREGPCGLQHKKIMSLKDYLKTFRKAVGFYKKTIMVKQSNYNIKI